MKRIISIHRKNQPKLIEVAEVHPYKQPQQHEGWSGGRVAGTPGFHATARGFHADGDTIMEACDHLTSVISRNLDSQQAA